MDQPFLPAYPPTLGNALADAVARHGERLFLVAGERKLTYQDAQLESAKLAIGLLSLGLGKGTRVALLMPNTPDWVLCWFAAARMGAFTIPVSTLFQPPEIGWLLRHADIDTVLVAGHYAGHDYLERLEKAVPALVTASSNRLFLPSHPYLRRIIVWPGVGIPPPGGARRMPAWTLRGPQALLASPSGGPDSAAGVLAEVEKQVTPSDLLIGICTSGTTAEPKLVVHTHGSAIRTTHMYRPYRDIRADDRDYSNMPLFWLGGLNVNLLPDLYEGACLHFGESPKTDDVLDIVVRERITRLTAWPMLRTAIFDRARARGLDLSSLREGFEEPRDADGNVVPPRLRVVALLGMTESFGPHGVEVRGVILPEERAGSAGHAIAGVDRRIVDPETGRVLPPGEVGELEIRGFTLMQGYYKKERAEVFNSEGWFATGDHCRLDADGYIYFSHRGSEMIKSAGANVAPREVEFAAERFEGVREAIVFGIPDEKRGEAVIAIIIPKAGCSVDAAKLGEFLQGQVSSYKVPSEILLASDTDIPRTDAGKSKKNELKKRLGGLRAKQQPPMTS